MFFAVICTQLQCMDFQSYKPPLVSGGQIVKALLYVCVIVTTLYVYYLCHVWDPEAG